MSESQEPEVPQPETRDASLDRPGDSTVATATVVPEVPPTRRSFLSEVFFGADGVRAGWALLIYLTLFFALVSVISPALHHMHSKAHRTQPVGPSPLEPWSVFASEGLFAVAVLLLTWMMAKIEHKPILTFGLAPASWLPRLLAGLAWGLGFLSLLVFALRSLGLLVFNGKLLSSANSVRSGALWFASFCAVGLFEEMFFRGYMQSTLARGLSGIYGWLGAPNRQALGFWTAAFLISFGFGFTHRSNPGESPIGLLSAGLIGLVFCLSLWRTGSLWWAIGLHASWDWAQSFLYGVADSGTVIAGRLFATHPVGRPILSGGLTGPEGSVLILPIVLLIAVAVVITLPRKRTGLPSEKTSDSPTALDLA